MGSPRKRDVGVKFETAILYEEPDGLTFGVYGVGADGKRTGICRHVNEHEAIEAALSSAPHVKWGKAA